MPEKEIIALIRLQLIPGLGPVGARNLISRCGKPSAVFSERKMLAGNGLRQNLLSLLGEEAYQRRAEAEVRWAEKRGVRCLGYQDPDYPDGLRHCADSPLVLYARGDIRFGGHPLVSVVGTRGITGYGREACEAFVAGIAPANPIIISGFAYGIDICAQRTAMRYGLQTIAVMAHGLDSLYPASHRKYRKDLLANGGFLTEFPSGTPAEPGHFLRRNRVIAGISPATVVVESGQRGGSLVTADLAFGYDREVFAFPGRASDPQSAGCNALIRSQKAQLLTGAEDFLQAMDWKTAVTAERSEPPEPADPAGIAGSTEQAESAGMAEAAERAEPAGTAEALERAKPAGMAESAITTENSVQNRRPTPSKRGANPLPDDLNPPETALARCLAESGCLHLDDLAFRCQLRVPEAVSALFGLEMRGLVRCLPGKLFRWGR